MRSLGTSIQLHTLREQLMNSNCATVGTGFIDLTRVINIAFDGVVEWLIYEQDICPCDPLECARTSIYNIKAEKNIISRTQIMETSKC